MKQRSGTRILTGTRIRERRLALSRRQADVAREAGISVAYLNLIEHMDDFARGLVDTRRVVYVLSAVVFFLFLATKALQGNKGK